jgi:hypothetical protein
MSDYEAERQANIEANRQLMASLGIQRVRPSFPSFPFPLSFLNASSQLTPSLPFFRLL